VDRISEARNRTLLAGGAPRPAHRWLHALMQARARVLMDTSVLALRKLQELPAVRPGQGAADRLASLYASSMASSRLRDHALAAQHAADARQLLAAQSAPEPEVQRALWLLDAEGRLAAGEPAGSLALLAQVQQQWPASDRARPALMMQAHAALQLQGTARADALRASTEALQTWVSSQPGDAMAWLLLGNTAEAQGLRLRALRAHAESRAAAGAAFGAHVDHPVGGLDHVQVVLDDDDGVAGVAQLVQHLQQQLDVVEVQAGGGLVQDVERAAGVALAQLQRQLHALRFAARQAWWRSGPGGCSPGPRPAASAACVRWSAPR
jgi:hypothetical protein